ncbi:hypothetical protein F511_33127 [Dorcoceras hygrometricum]|uniref:Uncharacterized protein n=1 Tax=Dorcoceras hygrometricum TaxID=472368 RepID=A0A2Z7CSM2_9LAMI|nr:hypothetical protein F511_33127 [Dorcoceras hygrometricum]
MRIRPPDLDVGAAADPDPAPGAQRKISILNRERTRSVLGKWVYLATLAMSLFDLQDVCIAIGSLATLDLPMVVDLIGIYVLKGPYCTLTTTNWLIGGRLNPVVDLIGESTAAYSLKCRFSCETGRSQAPRRQQEACQEPLIIRATSGIGDHSPTSLSPGPHMPTSFRLVHPRTTPY